MADDSTPPVACTLTEGQDEERYDEIRPTLVSRYRDAAELTDGYRLRFAGVAGTAVALARFVSLERECCAFADYEIAVSPPYEETRLRITGPEGTKALFGEGLVDLLEAEAQAGERHDR